MRVLFTTRGGCRSNLARTSLQTDMVFSDGTALQTPTITGDVTNGCTAGLLIAV